MSPFFVCVILCFFLQVSNADVELANGSPVEGTIVDGAEGTGPVTQFLGIPYAEPPVNESRFRAPVPKRPWTTPLASKAPPACIQSVYPTDPIMIETWWKPSIGENMQEDCLYLNVWVPNTSNPDEKLAVMVWIHGGGFYAGSSTPDLYDGRILASKENVIVVSIQYRLGIFGFAYSGLNSRLAPGNAGLLDQVLALQWIQSNIGSFGGDPAKVTLFGQSAGSTSIGYHLLSRKSQPYFSRMILQSGSPIAPWALLSFETAKNRTFETAKRVGCGEGRARTMMQCMTSQPALALFSNSFFMPDPLGLIWGPIIDGKFLTMPIYETLQRGNFKNGSILLGSNKREFNMFFPTVLPHIYNMSIIQNTSNIIRSDKMFYQIEGVLLPLRMRNDEQFRNELKAFYPLNADREEVLDEIFGDLCFTCPVLQLAKFFSESGHNAYVYSFEYHSPSIPTPSWMGALHGDELPFIFGLPFDQDKANRYTEEEQKLSNALIKSWANYAKYGNPNGDQATEWPNYGLSNEILVIDENLVIGKKASQKGPKCNFWASHVPRLPLW